MVRTEYPARYYDGQTATARDVGFRVTADTIEILEADRSAIAWWPLAAVTVRGNFADDAAVTAASCLSPEARLRIADRGAAEALLARLPKAAKTDRVNPRRVAGWSALGLAVVGLLALGVHSLPRLAAPLLPFEAKRSLGHGVADMLFEPGSHCAGAPLSPLQQLAERLRLAAGIEHPLDVIVADHPMVNAFAAPGGVVVVTRGLIMGAKGPDEVAGVLAHEIGHVAYDHPTQGMLRNIGISAVLKLLTGGSDLENLAGTGGFLAFLSYSRAAEEEADATAIKILAAAGIDAGGLSRFFARLETQEAGLGGLLPSWLSTHPPTEARRLATAEAAAGEPALEPEAWGRLQTVCSEHDRPAKTERKATSG